MLSEPIRVQGFLISTDFLGNQSEEAVSMSAIAHSGEYADEIKRHVAIGNHWIWHITMTAWHLCHSNAIDNDEHEHDQANNGPQCSRLVDGVDLGHIDILDQELGQLIVKAAIAGSFSWWHIRRIDDIVHHEPEHQQRHGNNEEEKHMKPIQRQVGLSTRIVVYFDDHQDEEHQERQDGEAPDDQLQMSRELAHLSAALVCWWLLNPLERKKQSQFVLRFI